MSASTPHVAAPVTEPGVFTIDQPDELDEHFRTHGYAVLRGVYDPALIDAIEAECVDAQAAVVAGELDPKHGGTVFVDDAAGEKATAFANYVLFCEQVSPSVKTAVYDPRVVALVERWLGPDFWVEGSEQFGIVYQDARAGRESSYTRIGWHSDWQSGPHLDIWPSVAFTIHIDATSPDNGFLRVVPGSHRWATPAPYANVNGAVVPPGSKPSMGYTSEAPPVEMPLRFEKVPGEIALYAERGDLLFHDAYLWHSAARATADAGIRRHVRGGYYSGSPSGTAEDFVKNAAR